MLVLLLGGTRDARQLVETLCAEGVEVIYSIAGKVRNPKVPCELLVGGFSRHGGMSRYIQQRGVGAILDATHPYAVVISQAANAAAAECAIPCWRYLRPCWQAEAQDHWQEIASFDAALPRLAQARVPLLTLGQLEPSQLQALQDIAKANGQRQVLRTAVAPPAALPACVAWIQGIGPFALQDERQLLLDQGIDLILCKNSGGDATWAKLQAARELGIPVLMLARPEQPAADESFSELDDCARFVIAQAANALPHSGSPDAF